MRRPEEIDTFPEYIEEGKVERTGKDPAKAESLRKRSASKFSTMEKLEITKETATDYLENVYEACKMLFLSRMATEGLKPYSHEAIAAYAIDRTELDMVEANLFNKYRKLRNDISYRGEIATVSEAKDIRELYIRIKKALFKEK
ncbi:MAG: hypothetical protein ABEJ72_07935 [Candidatus Aenigmatarchaeota archaeon]